MDFEQKLEVISVADPSFAARDVYSVFAVDQDFFGSTPQAFWVPVWA